MQINSDYGTVSVACQGQDPVDVHASDHIGLYSAEFMFLSKQEKDLWSRKKLCCQPAASLVLRIA